MANQVHLAEFISRLIAPMAAKQGAHSRLKIRNEYAASCVIPSKSRTPNTPTTSSFATRPMMVAMVAVASPKPSGAKIQQIALPITPRMLLSSSISASNPNEPSTVPKQEPAQMMIEEIRIIVPAFLMKDQPRSHMERSTLPTVGQW